MPKNQTYKNFLPALLLAMSILWLLLPAAKAAVPALPTLNWQQRSDWINVKTGVTPAAVGDGVHDDTAAIQAGLNLLSRGYYGSKTLYLPAGTYRISKTLTLDNIYGALIIGQGQATRIVWNGPLNQGMYISNGASRSRYVGIIWDGANKASVGVEHHSRTVYETFIRHQDEAFLNFRTAGIQIGHQEVCVTSEVSYRNCLFQSCAYGVIILGYNNLNNNFAGCEFQDNGMGINCMKGNAYVRDCHFERNSTTDIFLASSAYSVRRCTSVGSRQFITVPFGGGGCALTAEDCHVDGWTGSQGAMSYGCFGPTTVFDCSFTNPPDSKAPIRLTNAAGCQQPLIVCNTTASSSQALVDPGADARVSYLPSGTRGPNLNDASHSFLKSVEAIPTSVLDVKTRFGAKGDDSTDDTAAIMNALNAARSQVNAVVYFPEGIYRVSRTLPITGGNYMVEGAGCQSTIRWMGAPGGVVFSVQDPQTLALKNLLINAPADTACIQQTSTGASPSRMTYEQLSVGGGRGLECIGLSGASVVNIDDFDGSTQFTNCSRAVILGGFLSGGVLRVDGAQYAKTGFLGVLTHNDCSNACDVIIKDNQDLVGTNFYTEQTQAALSVSGDGAQFGQPGHVTIEGNKTQTDTPTSISINDYEGRVTYAGAGMWSFPSLPPVAHSGVRPVDIVLLGDNFNGVVPNFTFGSGAKLTSVCNFALGDPLLGICQLPTHFSGVAQPDTVLPGVNILATVASPPAPSFGPAVAALDDFRLLGAYDLSLNYP